MTGLRSDPDLDFPVVAVEEAEGRHGNKIIRIKVTDKFYNQAERGCVAHAEGLGLDNAPSKQRRRFK